MINHQAHLEERVGDRMSRIQGSEQQQTEIERMAGTGGPAARIAHEINNRLASIKGCFMFIQDAIPPDHPYHRNIGRIHGEINQIARILGQLSEL